MMSRAARWGRAALIGIAVCGLQLLGRPISDTMSLLHQPRKLAMLSAMSVCFVGLAWLSLWSWDRLRPMWRDEQGRWHIDMSVMGFGLTFGVGMAVREAASSSTQAGWSMLADWTFWSALAFSLLLMVPVGLWAGRLWGGALDWTLGRHSR